MNGYVLPSYCLQVVDIQSQNKELTIKLCDSIGDQTVFFAKRQSSISTVTSGDYWKLKVRKLSGITNFTNKWKLNGGKQCCKYTSCQQARTGWVKYGIKVLGILNGIKSHSSPLKSILLGVGGWWQSPSATASDPTCLLSSRWASFPSTQLPLVLFLNLPPPIPIFLPVFF